MHCGPRRGQIVVLAPMALVVVCAAFMLSVDVGRLVNTRARLQNVGDAASLAAAQVLLRERIAGTEEASARALARTEAERLRDANWTKAGLEVEFGELDGNGGFYPLYDDSHAWAVRVRAARDSDAPGGKLELIFGSLFGAGRREVAVESRAQLARDVRAVRSPISPFAIPRGRIPAVGEEMTFYPGDEESYDEGLGHDKVVPGNWGLLNLNGGSFGSSEVRDWVENGYHGGLTIPETGEMWIDGGPGFRATLDEPLRSKVGESMTMVVYDEVSGTGSNAQFRCVGFVRVTITGVRLVGNNPYARGRVDEMIPLRDVEAGAGGYASPNMAKIQLAW